MKIKNIFLAISAFVLLSLGTGCGKPPATEALKPSEADKNFINICEGTYHFKPRVYHLNHTLYIYVPTEKPILEVKASDEPPQKSNQPQKKSTINYLDVSFENNSFLAIYDISTAHSYSQTYPYSNVYSDDFNQTYRQLTMAFYQAYAGLDNKKLPGDVEFSSFPKQLTHEEVVRYRPQTEAAPEFIVFIIADIKAGLEVISTFNSQDFKRYMSQGIPQEEYQKRTLTDSIGQKSIRGDTEGKHITYKEITWPYFLSKQIETRIKFKYQQSDFKPEGPENEVIAQITRETLAAYNFKKFENVTLIDLASGRTFPYTKEQLFLLTK